MAGWRKLLALAILLALRVVFPGVVSEKLVEVGLYLFFGGNAVEHVMKRKGG